MSMLEFMSDELQQASIGVKTGLISLAAAFIWIISCVIYAIFLHPLRQYPGPLVSKITRLPYWKALWTGKQVEYIYDLHKQYGPVLCFGPSDLSYANGQEAWNDIYGYVRNRPENPKDVRFYSGGGGESLITANHSLHARIRRTLAPAFSERSLRQQEPLFLKYADMMVLKLQERLIQNSSVDMTKILNFTTFDIMAELTFGKPLGLLEESEYTPWVSSVFDSIRMMPLGQILSYYPSVKGLFEIFTPTRVRHKREAHYNHAKERVDNRLAEGSSQPDIWNLIVSDDGESKLTPEQMYSNARVFMTAGTETTATLLSGLTYYLLKNPEKLAKLQHEVRGAFDSDEDISLQKLADLKYLHACLQEALRVYPPVPAGMPRMMAAGGGIVCGRFVPAGTNISAHHTTTYRNPTLFKNPDLFVPERWLQAKEYANDRLDAVQPFHIGPRNCLGLNMAYHEMRLLLAKLIYNFDFELCEESYGWKEQNVYILWEKNPLLCRLRPARRPDQH